MNSLAMIAGTLCVALAPFVPVKAVTFAENFSTEPTPHGWGVFGNTNLFHWDSTNQNLRVTWDSSQTNSYFHHPLGTVLTSDDDFSLSFDLNFSDYVSGTNPGKPYAFQAALGFLNLAQATQTNFSRGAGTSAAYGPNNLVEFNFFPAFSTYLPTIGQVIVSTNNVWLYNHDPDNLLDMTPGQTFRVTMNYAAASRTLATTVTNNGTQYGPTQLITVPTNFDFRVSSFSISSYSDQRADGSILARGTVDNIMITVPPPPVMNFTGAFSNAVWRTQFLSRTNWLYMLERAASFTGWTEASPTSPGTGTMLSLADTNPPWAKSFYRIRAERP